MTRVGADERARLHEVASALAGVRAATALLNMPGDLAEERRAAMAEMVQRELQRLQRMVQQRQDSTDPVAPETSAQETEVVDLDAVVGSLARAHEAKGTSVEWRPSRLLALGDADQMTEALNVLLDNAASHGGGSVLIDIGAADRGETSVEIAVTDHGPGIAPELRRRIFAWGVKAPHSAGQGIGLHLARDLMERQGGYLELVEVEERTTVVLGIPMLGRVVERETAAGHRAVAA